MVGGPRVLVPAVVLAVLTLVAGSAIVLSRPSAWTASASFAVLPQASDAQTEAGYYETLSRGQIVSTIAEVISAQAQPLPAGADTEVSVLPETSFVRLTARADSRSAAVRAADDQLEAGFRAVDGLGIPFEPRLVERPEQTVEREAPDQVTGLAIVALGAGAVGLLVQQGLALLVRVRQQQRRPGSVPAAVD